MRTDNEITQHMISPDNTAHMITLMSFITFFKVFV